MDHLAASKPPLPTHLSLCAEMNQACGGEKICSELLSHAVFSTTTFVGFSKYKNINAFKESSHIINNVNYDDRFAV